jgi:hypothetical protein
MNVECRCKGAPQLTFDESVRELLQKVECREAILEQDKELIYRLRYAAYKREGALPPGAPEIFEDRFDGSENGRTFGLYIEGRLASSIRIHVICLANPDCPATTVFSDHLYPLLNAGKVLIDPTRFVIDEECARAYPKLPYATVRVGMMAAYHFRADIVLATVRTEHQAFYVRLFGHRLLCEARPYPTLSKPLSLMMTDVQSGQNRVLRRYPFLNSTEVERRSIFGEPLCFRSGKSPFQQDPAWLQANARAGCGA